VGHLWAIYRLFDGYLTLFTGPGEAFSPIFRPCTALRDLDMDSDGPFMGHLESISVLRGCTWPGPLHEDGLA